MDLQTRKLNAIEYIAGLKDEKIFKDIESAILESKAHKDRSIKPFTEKQLLTRAERSNRDYATGNIKLQDKLEKESQDW